MALPNVAKLRKLTEEAWKERSQDVGGQETLVNSFKSIILRQAEEVAKMGFKKATSCKIEVYDANDAEMLERLTHTLRVDGFEVSWDWGVDLAGYYVKLTVRW